MTIKYLTGDATKPSEPSIIMHICNNRGAWGAGFVMALNEVDITPMLAYQDWYEGVIQEPDFALGQIQEVKFKGGHIVVNMIAQNNYRTVGPLVDYDALKLCLRKVASLAKEKNLPVAAPKIGSGIGGGDWLAIEWLIDSIFKDVTVNIYTLDK